MGCSRPIRSADPTHHPKPGLVCCTVMDRRPLRSERPCSHLSECPAHEEPLPSQCEPGYKTIHWLGALQCHHGSHHLHPTGGYETCHFVDDYRLGYHVGMYDYMGVIYRTWSWSVTQSSFFCKDFRGVGLENHIWRYHCHWQHRCWLGQPNGLFSLCTTSWRSGFRSMDFHHWSRHYHATFRLPHVLGHAEDIRRSPLVSLVAACNFRAYVLTCL
jgi:hypothetical protein